MSELEQFEHGYAVVIGVDDNAQPSAALPTVAKDVRAIKDVLVHPQRCAYMDDNVTYLHGTNSTRANILGALDRLKEKVDADPQATVVIYYSGHGHVDKGTGKYYLIPYDYAGLNKLDEASIPAAMFTEKLAAIQAPRALIVLDCCHAEGMGAKALDGEAEMQRAPFPLDLSQMKSIPDYEGEPGSKALDDLLDGEGRAVLNSSTDDQLSWVMKDGSMSLFTYHLIEGLTGHATDPDETVILVTDVMSWVQRQVKRSAEREGRPAQTPVMRTDGVFPVAQSIGGQGVSKGLEGVPPDPRESLPSINVEVGKADRSVVTGQLDTGGGDVVTGDVDESKNKTIFDQSGQTVQGGQTNIAEVKGDIGHIGDVVQGNKVGGDMVGGDKITVGSTAGSGAVAIGRGASASQTIMGQPARPSDTAGFDKVFAPLATIAAAQDPALAAKVDEIVGQVTLGSGADDEALANLIMDLAAAAPDTKAMIKALFSLPQVAPAIGAATRFALGRLG